MLCRTLVTLHDPQRHGDEDEMSRVTVKAEISESTQITVSLTMQLSYWRTARGQLVEDRPFLGYEAAQVIQAIRLAIDRADKEYTVPYETQI